MICKNCNQEIYNNAAFCPHCGVATGQSAQPQQPVQTPYEPNAYRPMQPQPPAINQTPYLIWAIIATVFCCLPLGIAAIVYATKINSELAAGNYRAAQDAAKKSKIFSIVSTCIGVVSIIFFFLFMAFIGVGIAGYHYY